MTVRCSSDVAAASPATRAAAGLRRSGHAIGEFLRAPGVKGSLLLVLPALLLVSALFVLPLGILAGRSVGTPELGLQHYETLLQSSVFLNSLGSTLRIAFWVVLGCLLFGVPIGYALATCPERLRPYLAMAVLLPFWTSILVRNFSWIYLLRRRGVVNEWLLSAGLVDRPVEFMFNEFGVVLGMTNALLPFMVLPVFVAFQSQDKAYLEAAASLGARPEAGFLHVTLPLCLPGIFAGSLLVFASALGFYVTPALLGGGKVLVTATFITRQIETALDFEGAAAASMLLLAVVVLVVAAYIRLMSIDRVAGAGDATA